MNFSPSHQPSCLLRSDVPGVFVDFWLPLTDELDELSDFPGLGATVAMVGSVVVEGVVVVVLTGAVVAGAGVFVASEPEPVAGVGVGVGDGAAVDGAGVCGVGVGDGVAGVGVAGAGVAGVGVAGAGVTGVGVTGAGVTGAGVVPVPLPSRKRRSWGLAASFWISATKPVSSGKPASPAYGKQQTKYSNRQHMIQETTSYNHIHSQT